MLAILKNYIKKKIPNNSKLYILLLFFKHFKFHLLKTLIQMIYFDFVKKNISIKVNENEILLTCQEFNTISYFIDNKINEKIILTFIYNYFKESNKVFLDIGGFIGLHSLICANSSDKSKIYSFEANQKIYNIFLKRYPPCLKFFNRFFLKRLREEVVKNKIRISLRKISILRSLDKIAGNSTLNRFFLK